MTDPSSTPTTSSTTTTTTTTPASSYPEIAAAPSATANKKTVFLIRHAHSMENQRIASMFNCFGDIGRFSMPKKSDVGASLELLKLEHDAPLSEEGHEQCATMKQLLQQKNFVETNQIELVVHSPLERAKQTCQELIGCSSSETVDPPIKNGKSISQSFRASTTTNNNNNNNTNNNNNDAATASYPAPIKRVVSLCLLEEKHQLEWLPGNSKGFEKRVTDFQQWLAQQPESVVCVVGHSQYFKKLLQLPFKFDNTDVYQVSFDPHKTTPNLPFAMQLQHHDDDDGTTYDNIKLKPQWYDLKLLHTSRCHQQQPQQQQQQQAQPNTDSTKAPTATAASTTDSTDNATDK